MQVHDVLLVDRLNVFSSKNIILSEEILVRLRHDQLFDDRNKTLLMP